MTPLSVAPPAPRTCYPILSQPIHPAGRPNPRKLTSTEAAKLRLLGVSCSPACEVWAYAGNPTVGKLYHPIRGTCSMEHLGEFVSLVH